MLRARDSVDIKLQAIGGKRKTIDMALIERDGTAWSASVAAGPSWTTVRVPTRSIAHSRAAFTFPVRSPDSGIIGATAPALRGAAGDRLHAENIDRLQLTVFPNSGDHARR